MLNLLNANILSFLDADICSSDNAVGQVVALAKMIVKVLQIAIPVGLIIMGTIDMGKSVIAGDEKKIKENQGKFVKRIISAVIVFLIPLIINVVDIAANPIANNSIVTAIIDFLFIVHNSSIFYIFSISYPPRLSNFSVEKL